jgi:hypothetical protein
MVRYKETCCRIKDTKFKIPAFVPTRDYGGQARFKIQGLLVLGKAWVNGFLFDFYSVISEI